MRRALIVVSVVVTVGLVLAGAVAWISSHHRAAQRSAFTMPTSVRPEPELEPEPVPAAWRGRFARFQADAETACRCTRRSPGAKKTCWAKFEQDIARYPHSEEDLMCGPIAPTSMCLGENYDVCIPTEYSQVPNASFCTLAEARAAVAVYREAERKRLSGESNETGERALVRLSQALARGEKVPAGSSPGCGG